MLLSRRGLLSGFGALLAAPAIVRASSLMPVKALSPFGPAAGALYYDTTREQLFAYDGSMWRIIVNELGWA